MKIKPGFSLLEIMIAIAIIALAMAVALPNLRGKSPKVEREQFIASLEGLAQFAKQNAIITHRVHKVVFDFNRTPAWIEQAVDAKKKSGEQLFERIKSSAARAAISWPAHFSFKQFFIEKFDELSRFSGGKTEEIWFFVVPDGLVQEVIINVLDTKDRIAKKPRQIGLVLNPFTARFKRYETFQQP